jgi:hypothetical protein
LLFPCAGTGPSKREGIPSLYFKALKAVSSESRAACGVLLLAARRAESGERRAASDYRPPAGRWGWGPVPGCYILHSPFPPSSHSPHPTPHTMSQDAK